MNNDTINAKTSAAEELQANEDWLSDHWLSALVLEIIMTIVAIHIVHIISGCAGLWHKEAGHIRDMWIYFASAPSWVEVDAKAFGVHKTWGNFALACLLEVVACRFFCKCFDCDFTLSEDNKSPGSVLILGFGVAIRLIAYLAVAIFSRSTAIYDRTPDWAYKKEYVQIAAHNRAWILFWLLVGVALMLILRAFVSARESLFVTSLLVIAGVIVLGAYFNESGVRTWSDAKQNVAELVANAGDALAGHWY